MTPARGGLWPQGILDGAPAAASSSRRLRAVPGGSEPGGLGGLCRPLWARPYRAPSAQGPPGGALDVSKKRPQAAEPGLAWYGDAWGGSACGPPGRLGAACVGGTRAQEHAHALRKHLPAVSWGPIPFGTSDQRSHAAPALWPGAGIPEVILPRPGNRGPKPPPEPFPYGFPCCAGGQAPARGPRGGSHHAEQLRRGSGRAGALSGRHSQAAHQAQWRRTPPPDVSPVAWAACPQGPELRQSADRGRAASGVALGLVSLRAGAR
jgi:hypothetical protein